MFYLTTAAIAVHKVKRIQQFVEITSPLWEIICHMGSASSDFPAFTPAEAGTRFSNPGGMPADDLGGGYIPR